MLKVFGKKTEDRVITKNIKKIINVGKISNELRKNIKNMPTESLIINNLSNN